MKKFISALITIILIAWVCLLAYDYYRSTKNQPPVVVLSEEKHDYSDGYVHEYTSFGYKYIEYNRASKKGFMFGGFWLKVEE